MTGYAYTIVYDADTVTAGCDYTGHYASPAEMAARYRQQSPLAVEIRVWDGEHRVNEPAVRLFREPVVAA